MFLSGKSALTLKSTYYKVCVDWLCSNKIELGCLLQQNKSSKILNS